MPGLVPVIAQDAVSGRVLMLAWADREALRRVLASGQGWYYSRSRREYWRKGASSGNTQEVLAAYVDCDHDAVLLQVRQTGPACHTGNATCFFTPLDGMALDTLTFAGTMPVEVGETAAALQTIAATVDVIADRATRMPSGSYVAGLLGDPTGLRPLQKVGEEAVEFVLAAAALRLGPADDARPAAVGEAADLLFHYLVALQSAGITLADVAAELRRRQPSGAVPAGEGEKLTGQEERRGK
jgi:phosphoribosyl-ATP pyrophosphohydrolase/phosphoribosyl-AMP cyclohydrolase